MTPPRKIALAAALGLAFGAPLTGSATEELSTLGQDIGRAVERPAHERLMRLVRAPDTPLAPFETDGCSGGMSSLWAFIAEQFPDFAEVHRNEPPWQECCVVHDRAYHNAGGAREADASFDARLEADRALRACVVESASARVDELVEVYDTSEAVIRDTYEAIGVAMFQAVRLGGGPCSGLPWQWGFGYPACPGLFD